MNTIHESGYLYWILDKYFSGEKKALGKISVCWLGMQSHEIFHPHLGLLTRQLNFGSDVVLLFDLFFGILLIEEESQEKPTRSRLRRPSAEFGPRPAAVELQTVPR